MHPHLALTFPACLSLMAQAPAAPAVKWRGALWASAAASDQTTADGSMFLRSLDAGNGQMALDGLQLGADVALPDGWAGPHLERGHQFLAPSHHPSLLEVPCQPHRP